MLMGFYPNVIVVDAGDTVIWTVNSMEPHTVTFLSGEPNLNPFEERSLAPIGGNVYNGTGIYSSGLMMQGMSYNLTFTQPGVYVYGCLIHAGMTGVVVVQPRGSPYPYTQAQYDQIAAAEEANDLATATPASALTPPPPLLAPTALQLTTSSWVHPRWRTSQCPSTAAAGSKGTPT